MHMKSLLSAGLAALTLGLAATTAQAAPLGSPTAAVAQDVDRSGAVEKVTWYGGYGYRDYGYRPYYRYRFYRPYKFRFYKPYRYGRFYGGFGRYERYGRY